MPTGSAAELTAFLDANPDVERIDAMLPDIAGRVRGKRFLRKDANRLFQEGMFLPAATFLIDANSHSSDPLGHGISDGDPDRAAFPVPGTLRRIPWAKRPSAQVLVTMSPERSNGLSYEPRYILSKVLERFAEDGLTPVVALEYEFYLLDQNGDSSGNPQLAILPGSRVRESRDGVLDLQKLDDVGPFLARLNEICREQDIPIGCAVAEFSAGQYEVNLDHTNDALRAADHGVLLKRAIGGTAAEFGMRATFMPKPFLNSAGSGLHFHVSICDRAGANIFDNGTERGSDELQFAVGGVLKTMGEMLSIFAPSVNSYRRLCSDGAASLAPTWGINNRAVFVRIPAGPTGRRLEHRIAGADANPYLALAAVLAGMHWGMKRKSSAGEPCIGKSKRPANEALPESLMESLDCLVTKEDLKDYIPVEYRQMYRQVKLGEWRSLNAAISPKEYECYL